MRLLGCLLMVVAIAVLKLPLQQATRQTEEAATEPRWEYRVLTMDLGWCANNDSVNGMLNDYGKKGWELVSFQQTPALTTFPQESHGTILIRPASTGYGKEVQPNLTDSFQGTFDLKTPTAQQPGACRLVFARQVSRTGQH